MGAEFSDDWAEELAFEVYREEMLWRKSGNQMHWIGEIDE